jgi:YihY family inner membrane protein
MRRLRDSLGPAFDRLGSDNVTGLAAMVAYNLAISIVPFAILALWIAGRVAGSSDFESAISRDISAIFPGTADQALQSLLSRIKAGAPSVGLIAVIASAWTGMSFWGAIDTAFNQIYDFPSRGWLRQKRFAFAMLWLVVLFVASTVAVPAAQSAVAGARSDLPFGLADLPGLALVTSLAVGLFLLLVTLAAIYSIAPNGHTPFSSVWPGALLATGLITGLDFVFPWYLTHASAVWRFGTSVVFLVIVLLWFFIVSLLILLGAELNAFLLRRSSKRTPAGEPDSDLEEAAAA